jgi:hypothetical protein
MNAVGADEDIGFDLAAVGKARGGSAAARFDANAAQAEADVARSQRAGQNAEQVGAVR